MSTERELLRTIVAAQGDDACSYDHHGYCQTHYLHEQPCPVEQARDLLDAEPVGEGWTVWVVGNEAVRGTVRSIEDGVATVVFSGVATLNDMSALKLKLPVELLRGAGS